MAPQPSVFHGIRILKLEVGGAGYSSDGRGLPSAQRAQGTMQSLALWKPDVVVHACNFSSQKLEADNCQLHGLGPVWLQKTLSGQKRGVLNLKGEGSARELDNSDTLATFCEHWVKPVSIELLKECWSSQGSWLKVTGMDHIWTSRQSCLGSWGPTAELSKLPLGSGR